MDTISDYFEQAQLSMAAYAPGLQSGAFGSQNSDYVTALKLAGMSPKQARRIREYLCSHRSIHRPHGFLWRGQYGTINAEIIDVSNDAVTDEEKGLVYAGRVLMKQSVIRVREKSKTHTGYGGDRGNKNRETQADWIYHEPLTEI